jgi:hypothetical protein
VIRAGKCSLPNATIAAGLLCIVNNVIVFIFRLLGNIKSVSGVYVYRQRKIFAREKLSQRGLPVTGGDSDAL